MIDFIVALILIVIVGSAICYIVKAKKKGAKCIGCPDSCSCAKASGNVGCNCGFDSESNCNCYSDKK